jgi:hypothetical protein
MRPVMAVALAVVALVAVGVVSLASASAGSARPRAIAVGGVHDVPGVDHHWATIRGR